MKTIDKIIRAVTIAAVFAGIAGAQGDERTLIADIGLRAGSRGLILVIDGAGPMRVDTPPSAAERYPELRVTVNGARPPEGAGQFTPPAELPVETIALQETPGGVLIVAKMRGAVNGPVDLRGAGTNQVRILLTRDPQPEMNWSATGRPVPAARPAAPAAPPAQAGDIKAEPVDMKKMEERAVRDAQAPAGGDMFTVKDGPQRAPRGAARSAPAQQAGVPRIEQKAETPAAREEEILPSGEVTKMSPERELVRYKVYGRDPFVPLVKDTTDSGLPRLENLRLVGVLEDGRERIALVEDFKNGNRAFALRANDPVEHGKVLRVQRDRVVFVIRDFNMTRSYTLNMSAVR